MILPIYTYGQPVLRKVAEAIEPTYPNLSDLIANMFETMHASEGIGLAAPQIGLAIRLLVIDLDPLGEDDPAYVGFRRVMINAELLEESGDSKAANEGCLSIPGINEKVPRPSHIKVRYFDEQFVEHVEELDDFFARVVLHEYDHIEGKLFIDRISPIRKQLIKSKLTQMSKGIVRCGYRTKPIGR